MILAWKSIFFKNYIIEDLFLKIFMLESFIIVKYTPEDLYTNMYAALTKTFNSLNNKYKQYLWTFRRHSIL